ncbi:hypothetical protein [Pseudogulbenkiania sp. MAI-1]|uniref:pilus assembly PilX family protein n=1 Tax=Pseudogulbenkiania sp. MAI-1 TaxID=990370 RepID=UPI00045E9FBC|nr:hypothetical protein [Pseudogulbenkiania sp. MAI-1]
MRHFPSPLSRQHGLATLAVALIMLFLMSLLIFNTSSGMLLELKTGNNQYYQAKALEAARGGVDYTVSWLDVSGNYGGLAWSSDATGPSGNNQRAVLPSSVASQTLGGYSVAVTLWRNSANTSILEVRAIASGDASATVRQKIHAKTISFNVSSVPPLIINGCLSGVTGNPDIHPANSGDVVIKSSQASSCVVPGHLGMNGGVTEGNVFATSAWDYVFATSKADMKELAAQSSTDAIYYYDSSNPFSGNWHDDVGTASSPGILIFDTGAGCPKINGNVTIYGIVYYAAECGSDQGWGNSTIHGSVVSEGSITKLTANTDFYPWPGGSVPSYTIAMDLAKLPASWRDF